MNKHFHVHNIKGVSMKKTVLVVALAAVLVFAFATAAFATSAKTWNYNTDYYTWGSTPGEGAIGATPALSQIGDNVTLTSPHAGYTANTAKCGICHSVHRAAATGSKLTKAAAPGSCAACHQNGSTVTDVQVSWVAGGPHGSGTAASCNNRGCHADNPHGANGSAYYSFQSRLLTAAADVAVATAAGDSANSGVTPAVLADGSQNSAASAVRTGYTCNISGCHDQTMLAVLEAGWSESRVTTYGAASTVPKTGHLSVGSTNAFSFAAVTDCESCHDQTDSVSRSGFTFPHSQTAAGTSNTSVRSYLWMTISDELGNPVGAMTTTNDKPKDGACLKCHRDGAAGIGLTH